MHKGRRKRSGLSTNSTFDRKCSFVSSFLFMTFDPFVEAKVFMNEKIDVAKAKESSIYIYMQ